MLKTRWHINLNPLLIFFYPLYVVLFILLYSHYELKYDEAEVFPRSPHQPKDEVKRSNEIESDKGKDGIAALQVLGFTKAVARQKVSVILESNPDATPEDIVKIALSRTKN